MLDSGSWPGPKGSVAWSDCSHRVQRGDSAVLLLDLPATIVIPGQRGRGHSPAALLRFRRLPAGRLS
jgi:hypothetical protein